MPAGGKKKTDVKRKKTALERTSPKTAAALEALEAKQDNSSRNRALEDYEANRFKILDGGGTGREAARYAREQAEKDKKAGFGYGLPEIADFRERQAGLRGSNKFKKFKKGGKVRGCGIAKRGLTKGRMV